MPVSVSKLVELFDDSSFRAWLEQNLPQMLQEVDGAKAKGLGAAMVEAQVVSSYNKVYAQPELREKFRRYILANHPQVVGAAEAPLYAKLMIGAGPDPNGVFTHYHPNLLRFPMQIMFGPAALEQLNAAMGEFTERFEVHEELVVGDRGYVEYVPPHLARFSIPANNWEIPKYRAKINK